MKIRLIDAGTVPGLRSQAIYHGLAYAQTPATPDTVVLVTPGSPYMCIGYFQDAGQEIDLDWCGDNRLPVIRRETGGGAVYIDDGQLFVQWIFQQRSLPVRVDQRFQLFVKPLVETYRFFGIDAYYHPINDVHVNGKKIVGTGAATIGRAQVVTGNFLFHFDFATMLRAVNLPSSDFRAAVERNLAGYLTTMKQELGRLPDRQEVIRVYARKCAEVLGGSWQPGDFTDEELEHIAASETKLSDPHWLHSIQRPNSGCKLFKIHLGVWIARVERQVREGKLTVLATLREGLLAEVKLYRQGHEQNYDLEILADRLKGLPLEEQVLNGVLEPQAGAAETREWTACLLQIKDLIRQQTGYGTEVAGRN